MLAEGLDLEPAFAQRFERAIQRNARSCVQFDDDRHEQGFARRVLARALDDRLVGNALVRCMLIE